MKDTGIVRVIDEMGRLVLPKEMRRKMDIESGDEIEFFTEGDRIVLRKFQPACLFCGGDVALTEYKGKRICGRCLDELKQML
ncbi:MAG: AbrB/MazE/SpoVT family DNA-binding domain-containing protein [Clostridia bacterium]|nr:AbrB/MazE/SpoVT family DNA-binding domain-containing protein [Clostridia bacterium]MBO7171086.1 AbrB/MazE/SpoVT family DNA-binding domain-containing protein [Clostridia bacterium]